MASRPASLGAFVAWLEQAPGSTMLAASELVDVLGAFTSVDATAPVLVNEGATMPAEPSWRERLWLVPVETRIDVREAAEALGRPVSFVYRHTSAKSDASDRLPHRKLDGELLFVVGELRTWIADHEETIEPGRMPADVRAIKPRRAS